MVEQDWCPGKSLKWESWAHLAPHPDQACIIVMGLANKPVLGVTLWYWGYVNLVLACLLAVSMSEFYQW